MCKSNDGACVACQSCDCQFHVACAIRSRFTYGFELQTTKGSRREGLNSGRIGSDHGRLVAGIWCPSHDMRRATVYPPQTTNETGESKLQEFVRDYKQADLEMTGTVRKSLLVTSAIYSSQSSSKRDKYRQTNGRQDILAHDLPRKTCGLCGTEWSPVWWALQELPNAKGTATKEIPSHVACQTCRWKESPPVVPACMPTLSFPNGI